MKRNLPKKYKKPVLWWGLGFLSALALCFLLLLRLAGAVYLELPDMAKLEESTVKKPYDVIVVLTGGRGRIRKALELFEKGYGKTLYISGTDRQVQMKEILRELKWVGPVDETRIILERVSENTIENAEQVEKFVSESGLKKILLVTSIYHARRANFIFKKILPDDIDLDLYWFEAGSFDRHLWTKDPNAIWVTISEFFKFFYAYLKLEFVLPPTR